MVDRYYIVEGDIKVYYESHLDGGGTLAGQMFVPVLRRLGLGGSCYESFSGPAFIGFSLLGSGICDKLVVSDVNSRAIDYVKLTTELNGLGGRIKYYVSNLLEGIPRDSRFDLVVANPPHFRDLSFCRYFGCDGMTTLKTLDKDFELHKSFYRGIVDRLGPSGNVIFIESSLGSSPEDFVTMITEPGLKFRGAIKPTEDDAIYSLRNYARNYANTHSVSNVTGGFFRLVGSHIIPKLPSTLLKYAPIPSIRWTFRDMQKFYFTWASRD